MKQTLSPLEKKELAYEKDHRTRKNNSRKWGVRTLREDVESKSKSRAAPNVTNRERKEATPIMEKAKIKAEQKRKWRARPLVDAGRQNDSPD